MTKLFIPLFFVFIGYVHSQCASISPQTVQDCSNSTDNGNYCCLLSSPGYQPNSQQCVQISKNNFYGQTQYNYNNEIWKLNCGVDAVPVVNAGGPCGNSNPIFAVDCWSFSTLHNSCCLYLSGNTTGSPACQWYPGKHSGNTTSPTNNIVVLCSGNNASVNFAILVLSMIVLLVGIL